MTHQHCRATEANVQLMQAFGIRPVVLVRDLHDVIVSLRDYFNGGAIRTAAPLTLNNCSFMSNMADGNGGAIWTYS